MQFNDIAPLEPEQHYYDTIHRDKKYYDQHSIAVQDWKPPMKKQNLLQFIMSKVVRRSQIRQSIDRQLPSLPAIASLFRSSLVSPI